MKALSQKNTLRASWCAGMIVYMDKVSSRHVSWIDIENPTDAEVADLSRKYSIHMLVGKELLATTYRPKLERYDGHLYLVLHFPVFDAVNNATSSREIDFIIFPYNLFTIHYDAIPQLDNFQQLLAGHEAIRERDFGSSAVHLLHSIISRLFLISQKELDTIADKISSIQNKIFNGQEKTVLRDIALLRRDILSFRKALKPQQAVLDSLAEHGKHFFGPEAAPYFNDIRGAYTQAWNSVEDLQETLDVLYDTNISLLAANTNEVTKILTAFASILLPVQVILFFFGTNIDTLPLVHDANAAWIIAGLSFFVSLIIYQFFRQKKWI